MKRFVQILAASLCWAAAAGTALAATDTYLASLASTADSGDPKALTELGNLYQYAEGVPQDFQKARSLYCRAAKEGYAEAQFQLGWLYANGRGVARDDAVAAALFAMAAQQGHEYAARMLHYVAPRSETKLPACLTPDPPAATASDDESAAAGEAEIVRLVHRLAPEYQVDPKLVLALIVVESDFDATAVSPKNAQGLMQLIPATAQRFGVKRVFNPADNIKGGLAYLRWLLAYFRGNVRLVVAAYNAGEGAVEKFGGVPPYPETRHYVRKVTAIYKRSRVPFDPNVVSPSPVAGSSE